MTKLQNKPWHKEALELYTLGYSGRKIAKMIGHSKTQVNDFLRRTAVGMKQESDLPKILTLDIETAPMWGNMWSLWNNNFSLNQIQKDWHILSFCAHWLGHPDDEIIYFDNQYYEDFEDDTPMLNELWKLLDEADILLTQNGKKFDIKKIRARMVIKGLRPFKPVRHIDTYQIAKQEFGFTSNKLEYMTDKLCHKYKKSTHKKYAGFELWKGCINKEPEAYAEMKEYNILDVLSLEELYFVLAPWSSKLPNPNLYTKDLDVVCPACGGKHFVKDGFSFTDVSKFQMYRCKDCGHVSRDRKNLLSKEKRETIKNNVIER